MGADGPIVLATLAGRRKMPPPIVMLMMPAARPNVPIARTSFSCDSLIASYTTIRATTLGYFAADLQRHTGVSRRHHLSTTLDRADRAGLPGERQRDHDV